MFTTKEDNCMVKHLLIFSTILLVAGPIARASDRQNDNDRLQKAGQVFKEIMDMPDKGIPHELLDSAKCIAVIPGIRSLLSSLEVATAAGCDLPHGARMECSDVLAIEGGSVGTTWRLFHGSHYAVYE